MRQNRRCYSKRDRTVVLLAVLLCGACIDGEAAPWGPDSAALPEPTVWRVDPPLLGPDGQDRQREVERYIVDELYRGYWIVETTQTYAGDLIDWVDPDTVPGSQIEPPPPPTAADLETPPGFSLQPTELDVNPELRGPVGTIPFVRPEFDGYVRGNHAYGSLDRYLQRHHVPGQPSGVHRLFAGFRKTVPNTTVVGFINQSIGQIEPGTFSLLEVTSYCGGATPPTTAELVGGVVSKDLANFNDSSLRLRVEFLTAGHAQGNYKGGWDGKVAGFVAAAGRPYGPNVALTPSVIGGAQYESHFHIQNYNSNWWIAHNGNWLGYYPGKMFNLINTKGCEAQWYGEIYDPTPTDWTWTDMGSGYFANAGYKYSAHIRNPYYVSGGFAYWPDSPSDMLPSDSWCYTDSALLSGAAPWDRYFYLGGPGGNAYGCN